jgi:hypothetical protein
VAALSLAFQRAGDASAPVAAGQPFLHAPSPLALALLGLAGGGADVRPKGILIGGGAAPLGGAGGGAAALVGWGLLLPTGP